MGRLIALVGIPVVTPILLALAGVSQAADLALNKPATASSTQAVGWEPFKANDGNSSTRWSSVFSVPQWWRVDLGSIHSINRVELNWEIAYASRYRIQTRTRTRGTWSTAATITNSSAGAKVHTFASRNAREVRIYADAKGTPWGVSLWDAKLCDNNTCSPAPLPPSPPSPQCSDGVDNADPEDTLVDMADPGCSGSSDNDETNVAPPGTPPAIAGQGYSKVFGDEFNTIDPAVWRRSMYWMLEEPSDVFTDANGVAHIQSRRSEGYPNRSLSTIDTTAGGIPDGGKAWTRGYFEARIRFTPGTGISPSFWLISASDALNTNWPGPPPRSLCPSLPASFTFCPSAEFDILEHFPSNGADDFETTLHRNTSGRWGMPDQTRANFNHPGGVLGADWHVYSAKWTTTEVRAYLDGVQLGQTLQPWDTFDQSMFMILAMWTGVFGGGPDSSTPDVVETLVDWVRVWQQ